MVSICILGGGSSGWMTAAAFAKVFPHYKIKLIENPTQKPLSVGESTLGHFNRYLACLDIKDRDWMKECNATYKLSIQFSNWTGKGDVFQYPFGDMDYTHGDFLAWYYLHYTYPQLFPNTSYCEFYNPVSYLAFTNKMVDNNIYIRNFKKQWDTSYHFDATKFGGWLRDNLCQSVEHIKARIITTLYDEECNVKALVDDEGHQYEADWFIDCSGFKSVLLEGAMGQDFMEFPNLPNDSAVVTHIPYTDKNKEMANQTDGYAMDNGWLWTIPLWENIGKGYVYSSKFCSQDKAEQDFRKHLDWGGDVEHIKFKHGKRRLGWIKNVIGIGLSYGFLEPLESTGLFTTHENILRLVECFERRDGHITQIDIDGYNHAVSYELEAMKEFIECHYYLSPRTDTEYWRFHTNRSPMTYEQMFDKLIRSPRMYQELLHCWNISNAPKDLGGLPYIAAGLGYHPIAKTDYLYKMAREEFTLAYLNEIKTKHFRYRKSVLKYLRTQPTHYEYLKRRIYV
jgi:tryptophan halogenase